MSNKEHQSQERQFSQWLDDKTNVNSQGVGNYNADDELWDNRATTANFIANQVDVRDECDVPNWDRGAAFQSDKLPWWQSTNLSIVSLAFSFFAIALVLFKVELVMKPEGVLLSFGNSGQINQEEKIAALVNQQLQVFASEQQVVLANYAADIKVKQQESNLQLASYIMGTAREERKQDMGDFIDYINSQRAEEHYDQQLKFEQLEHAINFKNTQYKTNVPNLGMQPKSADWTTEE